MQLGWIDFSKSERVKVLRVLDMLSEKNTLDELGIAPIRDGFASRFFPGTSTIQRGAKYFFCVPYAFKEIERSGETNPNRMFKALSAIEKSCGEYFIARDPKAEGIIGSRALKEGSWVKRAPSDVYWYFRSISDYRYSGDIYRLPRSQPRHERYNNHCPHI